MLMTREQMRTVMEKSRRHVLLHGPPGTGKTTEARMMANGSKVYSMTITDDTSAPELLGHFMPNEKGGFSWHNGPCSRAWLEGALLILNEVNRACGGAEIALHAVLDDKEVAMLTLSDGRTISPRDGFRVIATMNGSPDELSDALKDRFPVRILVDTPSDEALAMLPQTLAAFCRNSYENEGHSRYSYRQIAEMAELARDTGDVSLAAIAVFGDMYRDVIHAANLAHNDES
jgi:MoxR-like ATPase